MDRFRHVMVGLTGRLSDFDLIRYASMLARLETAVEVRFVHVIPSDGPESSAPRHDAALETVERSVADAFLNVGESVRVYCDILKGTLIDRLLAFAAEQEIDVMLVGQRRDHSLGRGSLAKRLAMNAPCSVWIVPSGSSLTLKKILVPIDFSNHAADAMLVAASMAQRAGNAECLPLHVYFNESVLTYQQDDPFVRGLEEDAYHQFIATIDCCGAAISPLFVEAPNVAETIHRVGLEQSVDLKVMTTRGRSRSAAILLGSVTEGVISVADKPVLVVKHFGTQLGFLQMLLDRTFRQHDSPHF